MRIYPLHGGRKATNHAKKGGATIQQVSQESWMDYQICMQRCWMCHRRNSAKIASKFVAKKGVYSMVAIRRMHNQVQRYYERAKRNEPVCLFVYSLEITNQASFSLQHPWGDDHTPNLHHSRTVLYRLVMYYFG